MKKVLKVALAVTLVLCCSSAFAQKFGRINSQIIVVNMPEFKDAQTQLEAHTQEWAAQLETIQVEFNNKYQEFETKFDTLSDSVKQLKQKELEDLQKRYQEFQQIAQQEVQKKQMELMQPVTAKAQAAIDEVAKAGGYLVIFDETAGSLAYIDETNVVDIAPEVCAKLGVTLPAPETAATPAQ